MTPLAVRKTTLRDVPGIARLIRHYAERKFLLPRTNDQISENIRDFHVVEDADRIVACGALQIWSELAEVRSLAVLETHWRRGLGSLIVRACLDEARALGIKTVFTLTYQPDFFERNGFRRVTKERFPQKIWVDCVNCPQFPNCGEIALVYDVEAAAAPSPTSPTGPTT